MTPIKFDQANSKRTAPEGQEEKVGDLDIAISFWPKEGYYGQTSCWELTDEEVRNILRDKKVYVTIFSDVHPVMNIVTENPFRTGLAQQIRPKEN